MHGAHVRPSTYALVAAYILVTLVSVHLTWGDDFQIPIIKGSVFRDAAAQFRRIPPALQNVPLTMLRRAAMKPLVVIAAITFATILIFVYILPSALNYVIRVYSPGAYEKKLERRVIEQKQVGSWTCSNQLAVNAVCTTLISSESRIKLFVWAFVFGAGRYLAGGVQVWCVCISLMQLYMFRTGKSFWPLLIFTAVMALICALEQLRKASRDAVQNSRQVTLLTYPVPSMSAAQEKPRTASGALRPGNVIRLRPGDVVPADALILRVAPDVLNENPVGEGEAQQRQRPILGMNESSVTGETAIIRKAPYPTPEQITKISFIGEYGTRAMVNGAALVPDSQLAYANSIVVALSTQPLVVDAVVLWVGIETKALRPSLGPETSLRKQPSPLLSYTRKGFLLSISALFVMALLDTVVSVRAAMANSDVAQLSFLSLLTVFINQLMYLNMIVPQATEQMRLAVSHMLARHFNCGAHCNDPWSVDVLSAVTRCVTDKTGTLTQNRMQTLAVAFTRCEERLEAPHIITDELGAPLRDAFHAVVMAVISTTGVEPEEAAMREKLKALKYLVRELDIPDPEEHEEGCIRYICPLGKEVHLSIRASLGFVRELLCKAVLFKDESNSCTYLAVQAGGDDFWRRHVPSAMPLLQRMTDGLQSATAVQQTPGAPRDWSYGLVSLTAEAADKLLKAWREAKAGQRADVLVAVLTQAKLLAKVSIVDLYRPGIMRAISELTDAGKQIVMCTGDSMEAAMLIAGHLGFPPTHVIDGANHRELQAHISNLLAQPYRIARTYVITQQVMDLLRRDEVSATQLFELLNRQVRGESGQLRFLHRAVFCRATPELKPWVVELLQGKHSSTFISTEHSDQRPDYVMAIGDGANDLNMFRVADVSLGIQSGDSVDVCSQASLQHTEWANVVPLLHEDGVQKSLMLATMTKLIFLKHWMMASALWMHFLVSGFPLIPKDPCNPLITALYNGVVFSQISSHAASDTLSEVKTLLMRKVMSLRALVRWAAAASLSGAASFVAVRLFVPISSEDTLGVLLQVAQMFAVTVYLVSVTNTWTAEHTLSPSMAVALQVREAVHTRSSELQLVIGCCSLLLSITLVLVSARLVEPLWTLASLFAAMICLYPGLLVVRVLAHDIRFICAALLAARNSDRSTAVVKMVAWSHTKHGRVLLSVSFAVLLRYLTAEPLPLLVTIGLTAAIFSVVIFVMIVSNMGLFRALEQGHLGAVAITCFAAGFVVATFTLWH